MNDMEQEKVRRFLDDKLMSDTVFRLLQSTFLKDTKQTYVHALAAERMALNLLQKGWQELNKFQTKKETDTKSNGQIGV